MMTGKRWLEASLRNASHAFWIVSPSAVEEFFRIPWLTTRATVENRTLSKTASNYWYVLDEVRNNQELRQFSSIPSMSHWVPQHHWTRLCIVPTSDQRPYPRDLCGSPWFYLYLSTYSQFSASAFRMSGRICATKSGGRRTHRWRCNIYILVMNGHNHHARCARISINTCRV